MSKKEIISKVNPRSKGIPKEQIETFRDAVVSCAKIGCTSKEIGTIVGMSEASVRRHYREELAKGRGVLAGGIRKAQVEAAVIEKNPTMLIWLGKCYLGQKEPKQQLEHTGGITVEKRIFHPNAKKD